MPTIRSTSALVAITSIAVLALTACAAPQTVEPSETPTADASPSPTPTAVPMVYEQPTDCEQLLPQSRRDSFTAEHLVLLGGPGGKFGNDYLADETPEEQAGGLTCIWGDNASNNSAFTVSAAPLTAENRSPIIDTLIAQGLNAGTAGNTNTFGEQGDTTEAPAILNVLRSDSWISVISTKGGLAKSEECQAIADDVAKAVYRAA
ncbi:MAG: hypothetical protein EPN91_03335 [Salinibacterium sp.]|nr:MAG: hypothetical protein EPN91_03335 [Salinibacterium sp.]